MLFLRLTGLAATTALSIAAPSAVRHVLHEERTVPAMDWIKGARIEKTAVLPMRIGLTQTNLENGMDHLMDVSSPDSSNYGKYWSAEEVHDMFAPPSEHVDAVKEWLASSGIEDDRVVHSDNKGWLAFDATAEEAERLLLAEFHEHEHKHSPMIRVGCDEYHVPEHISPHIDYITPGIKLRPVIKRTAKFKRGHSFHPQKPKNRLRPALDDKAWQYKPPGYARLPPDLQGCGLNITPPCIKELYGIPNVYDKPATKGNSLGLYEQGDYFSKTDIDMFFKQYAPYVPQGTYPIPALIDGAQFGMPANSPENGGESDIDIDMAYSLIYPQTVTLYQTDDQIYSVEDLDTTNLFNTFLDALEGSYCSYSAYGETGNDPSIDPVYPDTQAGGYKGKFQCGVYKPTNVISASYGQAEADLPVNYEKRQCNEFMKLGLQGHSLLFASGDYGVASFPADGSADGCLGPQGKIFSPQYPGNCPYITSVGGTMLMADQTVYDPESVMQVNLGGTAVNFSSAGGFSNYYPQPSYQKEAVARYFETAHLTYPYYSELNVNVNTTKGLYNRIGRGYPDISANGAQFRAYTDGFDYHWYGSSLASPLFASVLTLINEERIAIGKGPVGFVNPVPPVRLERHQERLEPWVRYPGLRGHPRMGSSDGIGDPELPEDEGPVP